MGTLARARAMSWVDCCFGFDCRKFLGLIVLYTPWFLYVSVGLVAFKTEKRSLRWWQWQPSAALPLPADWAGIKSVLLAGPLADDSNSMQGVSIS